MVVITPSFWAAQMGLSDGAFFMIKHTHLPNGNHPILIPIFPMGVADTLEPWVRAQYVTDDKILTFWHLMVKFWNRVKTVLVWKLAWTYLSKASSLVGDQLCPKRGTSGCKRASLVVCTARALWHYRLWRFKTRDTKLEKFMHNNQHTQRKLLNFEIWTNGEPQ